MHTAYQTFVLGGRGFWETIIHDFNLGVHELVYVVVACLSGCRGKQRGNEQKYPESESTQKREERDEREEKAFQTERKEKT